MKGDRNIRLLCMFLTLSTFFERGSCQGTKNIRFLLLNGGSTFFEPVFFGYNKTCANLNLSCEYIIPNSCDGRETAVREFIASRGHGIIYRPCGDQLRDRPLIEEATAAGIPVVEFDGKTPDAPRIAYVGTDNEFMGRTMARLLRQLRPEGGTFAIVAEKDGRLEGFIDEITKDNHRPDRSHWNEIERNFTLAAIRSEYMLHMEMYAQLNPTAMVFMKQTPMRHPNWTNFVDANRHRNITLIGVDGSDFQLAYLDRRYVDGLIGQLPYDFGSTSTKVLYEYITTGKIEREVYNTNVVSYNLIPLELPPVNLDENLIGNLKYVGYFFFGTVGVLAIACVGWTWYYRRTMVVAAAQPFFLVMVATGVLLMASTLVPLSFDDGGDSEGLTEQKRIGICMSIPWLASSGFTVTFSALFSKTWRVNRMFNSKHRHSKFKLKERDVLLPFMVLFLLNTTVLVCWTVIDPLTYVRLEYDGTDFWNRVIATYGSCQSDHVAFYLIPLAMINCSVLVFACWHAYQGRHIKIEFSESKYIGLTMFSLVQGFLTGIPIVAVVRETPQAFYLVLAMLIFLLCMVTLLLIFLPKLLMQRRYADLSEVEQRKLMAQSVIESSVGKASAVRNPMFIIDRVGIVQCVDEVENPQEVLGKVKEASNERSAARVILSANLADPDTRVSVEDVDLDVARFEMKPSCDSSASLLKPEGKGEGSRSLSEASPTSEPFDSDVVAPAPETSEANNPLCPKEAVVGSDTEGTDSLLKEQQESAVPETSERAR